MRATFYQVLGIPANAKIRQIRSAIRFMLKTATLLPAFKDEKDLPEAYKTEDISNDLFSLAYHACAILLDAKKRHLYDQSILSHTYRNSLNQSRYQTLIQHTGGAIRRPLSQHFNLHPTPGKEHLGLLLIGFKVLCSDYWLKSKQLLRLTIITLLLGLMTAYVWTHWLHSLQSKEHAQLVAIALEAGKVIAQIMLGFVMVLFLYKFKRRLGISENLPEEEGIIFDSATWSMLDLSNAWKQEDRIFLGDEPIYEEAAWVFNVKMNHIVRSERKMIASTAPFRRLWARTIDMAFWGSICLILPFSSELLSYFKLTHSPLLATLSWIWFSITSWMLIEAIILSLFGTTPGRVLAGITLHLRTTSFTPKHYYKLRWYFNMLNAFKRTWAVWWYGLACGFLPLSIWQVRRFVSMHHQRNEAIWDTHADSIVMVHPITKSYTLLGIGWIVIALMTWIGVFFSHS